MIQELRFAARLAKGHLFSPWKSPYLQWRIETWSGIPAGSLDRDAFIAFARQHRQELWRYLQWAVRERNG